MEFQDISPQANVTEVYAFEELIQNHAVGAFIICLVSIILGLPLNWNLLWHLKVRMSKYEY